MFKELARCLIFRLIENKLNLVDDSLLGYWEVNQSLQIHLGPTGACPASCKIMKLFTPIPVGAVLFYSVPADDMDEVSRSFRAFAYCKANLYMDRFYQDRYLER